MHGLVPIHSAPLTPRPPTITKAPVVVLVLAVPLAATILPLLVNTPLDVNVVNAPVLAELAPIAVPFTLPPVITALPELKLVTTAVVIVALDKAEI